MKSILKHVLITAFALVVIVVSAIKMMQYLGIHLDLVKFFSRAERFEVTLASNTLPVYDEPAATISVSDITALRRMLEQRQFSLLNAALERCQKLTEQHPLQEFYVHDAFGAFNITLDAYEELLQRWVAAFPDNYQPHLALAQHYYAKGWESRGTRWAKDTTAEQFEGMHYYFSQAEDSLAAALAIQPNLMVAHRLLIGIHNTYSGKTQKQRIIDRALTLFPDSYIIRFACILANQPRWGGSYAAMEKIAKAAEPYYAENPRLATLYGFIYADQGAVLRRDKKYAEAASCYTKALAFGENWTFYRERAEVRYFYLKELDQALADVNRGIELRPNQEDTHLLRARIYFALENYYDAIRDLELAETLKPGDAKILEWKEWAIKGLTGKGHQALKDDLQAAIDYFGLVIEFDRHRAEAYFGISLAYYQAHDFESALSNVNRAMELDPRHFESYRLADYLLMKAQKWETIIDNWDKFLSLTPNHAAAYLERAGAYYHKRELEKALRDLEQACALGNEEACRRYRSMK